MTHLCCRSWRGPGATTASVTCATSLSDISILRWRTHRSCLSIAFNLTSYLYKGGKPADEYPPLVPLVYLCKVSLLWFKNLKVLMSTRMEGSTYHIE